MNNLQRFAKANNFEYDKKREAAFARKDGYFIILKELKAKKQILIKMNIKNSGENSVDVDGFFSQLENENKFIQAATYKENEALIIISGSKGKIGENVNAAIKKIISFCNTNKLQNACILCGDNNGLSVYGVGEEVDMLCRNCYATAQIDIEEHLSKANFPKGLLGAFLGSLVGVALWIIIYQLGYIAGIAGAAMVIFAFKGFKMFGKELTLAGAICCTLISFVMIPLSVYISWSIELLTVIGDGITFNECFSSLIYIMVEEEEVLRGMVSEMLMGYVLYFVASISAIRSTLKSAKLQHKTEALMG